MDECKKEKKDCDSFMKGCTLVLPNTIPVEARDGPVPSHGDAELTWQTFADSSNLIAGLAHQQPNSDHAAHYHAEPEIFICTRGSARTEQRDGSWIDVGPGDVVYIPPNVVHRTIAGPEGLEVMYYFGSGPFSTIIYRRLAEPETMVGYAPSLQSPLVMSLSRGCLRQSVGSSFVLSRGDEKHMFDVPYVPNQSFYIHRGEAMVEGLGCVPQGGFFYTGPQINDGSTFRATSVGAESLEIYVVSIGES